MRSRHGGRVARAFGWRSAEQLPGPCNPAGQGNGAAANPGQPVGPHTKPVMAAGARRQVSCSSCEGAMPMRGTLTLLSRLPSSGSLARGLAPGIPPKAAAIDAGWSPSLCGAGVGASGAHRGHFGCSLGAVLWRALQLCQLACAIDQLPCCDPSIFLVTPARAAAPPPEGFLELQHGEHRCSP